MQPNPNGVNPSYPQPEFIPQAGTIPAPQWEQPQNVPNQLPPTQTQPPAPLNVQPPRQEIRPPEVNTSSFIPDAKTREILDRTYPELTNALINIAIKKYTEDQDYAAYFVREEFQAQAQEQTQLKEKKENPTPSNPKPASDFSTW